MMKFRPIRKEKLTTKVKGLFSLNIPYEVRVPDGNWSPFFGNYLNQKWGEWDTDDCWCAAMVNCAEDQLEWLYKNDKFSQEAKDFFTKNSYIDSDGDFSLSERFIEILGGNKIEGGTAPEAWDLAKGYGFIPRSMLTYTIERANSFSNEGAFVADYFNLAEVTPQMKALGQQFKKYVSIAYKQIGNLYETPKLADIQTALKQAPIQIGIPIPQNVSLWNQVIVSYDGNKNLAHEIELYGIDEQGRYLIYDQYEPHLKILSKDYYIGACHQGVINSISSPVIPSPVLSPIDAQRVSILQAILSKVSLVLLAMRQLLTGK